MGSTFEITVVAANEEIGYINIEEAIAEVERIEALISSWKEDSETSRINRNAGIRPVKVSLELYKLIERAVQISEITDGAFDITYAALDEIWKFDGSMQYPPTAGEIGEVLDKVDYNKVVLNSTERTVFLKEKGMKIGFGAIGKGYASDKVKELMVSKQVKAGMINAGGDITAWGTKATGERWLIGIVNPQSRTKIFSWLPLVESSVAITGSENAFVSFNGKKYTHIIDPKNGYPSIGISKVTVLGKSAELCDALATAVFVMGKERGLALINQLGGTEAIIVDNLDIVHQSQGIMLDK
ncbi:FAD:protein FMN transferase [Flavobacteriaceae bacterium R33]|uniref:FAD:protein FMN transferase n=2 Tax=Poritiphilus flavus TaxID=2697053 RepID=A0A6L9E8U3_9FLAO|nr:FAD:protein FMN transferase [Poritiphilus flavus]